MRLSIRIACGMSLSHRCSGKFLSVVQSPATKWFLNVCMAWSAALHQCCPAGTNWKYMPCFVMYSVSRGEHSLSILCSLGQSPAFMRVVWTVLNARRILGAVQFLIGSACIELLS